MHMRYHPAFLLCPYMLTTVPFTASCAWWHYLSLVNHNIPSSFALLITMPPFLLELTLGQKRTQNSLSSESSSSTVKLVSSWLQNRQRVKHHNLAEALSWQQDRRAKKCLKLTGLTTPFYSMWFQRPGDACSLHWGHWHLQLTQRYVKYPRPSSWRTYSYPRMMPNSWNKL